MLCPMYRADYSLGRSLPLAPVVLFNMSRRNLTFATANEAIKLVLLRFCFLVVVFVMTRASQAVRSAANLHFGAKSAPPQPSSATSPVKPREGPCTKRGAPRSAALPRSSFDAAFCSSMVQHGPLSKSPSTDHSHKLP